MSEQINETNKPKDLDLLNKMKKLPGGLVIIPLVLAVLIATFFPQAYQIGGYVTALFYEGNSCMMGFFLIVCGSAINIKQVGMPLYKGVTLTATKFILGVLIGFAISALCGPAGFLGIAPFVWIATITNSNGSLYISLSAQFGNATDTGAISILSLNDGPFFTLIALGATGLASIPLDSLIAVLVPLLIGFIWGNLDAGFRKACATAQPIVTFFMTISIGAKTDINTIITAGAAGIILGLVSAATAVIFFFTNNLLLPKKERNAMGAAIGHSPQLCHDTGGSRRSRPHHDAVCGHGYRTVRDSLCCNPVPLPVHHRFLRQADAEETAGYLLTGRLGTLQS